MANRELGVGPTALRVRQRVADVRQAQGLTLRQLSDRLDAVGWPLSLSVLSKIENGDRRVDVDDLVALAVALEVPLSSLLLPAITDAAATVFLTPNHPLPARQAWQWFTDRPSEPTPEDHSGRSSSAAPGRLPASDAEALVRLGVPIRFGSGTVLMHQDARADCVILLQRGRVKVVVVEDNGRESLLALRGPGDLIGEMEAFDGGRRSATVVALEPVGAVFIPIPAFLGFLRDRPGAAAAVLSVLARRLHDADRHRARFGAFPTAVRLARHLVDLADEHGRTDGSGAVVLDIRLTQADVAAAIGASRESVGRDLAFLRTRGMVAGQRRPLVLLDIPALRSFAGDEAPQPEQPSRRPTPEGT